MHPPILIQEKTIDLESNRKGHVLCKCFAQSLSVASPAPQTPSPSEPNSLCALGSLLQINTLQTGQTGFTLQLHTNSRTGTVKATLKITTVSNMKTSA